VSAARLIKRKLPVRPLFHQVDMMGVVHNVQYFYWFEEGRMQIAEEILPVAEAVRLHVGMPVTQNTCNYRKPVRYGDELVLYTTHRIQPVYEGRLAFAHSLVNTATKVEIANGTSVGTLVNMLTGQLVKEWPADIWQRYQELQ
jgi:acyl-CoA thioester hydrolase